MALPPNYYDRFNPTARYARHLFLPGRSLQAAELNEIQRAAEYRDAQIGNSLYHDGSLIRGAGLNVSTASPTNNGTCEAGAIYLAGAIREVPAATISVPLTGTVRVGIWLNHVTVTETDDPALREPATEAFRYQEPGAYRLRVDAAWGLSTATNLPGEFYPVWTVIDGNVQSKQPPPAVDPIISAIAAYDRSSAGGFYVSSGLDLLAVSVTGTEQVFSLSAGQARVAGSEVVLRADRRIVYRATPDLRTVTGEPVAATGGAGAQRINVARTPLDSVTQVLVTCQRTVNVTHGGFAGAVDALPDSPIVSIVECKQGATIYAPGTYLLSGDSVDWSPGGTEPAPGSTYEVTYRYVQEVTPTGIDLTGFTITPPVGRPIVAASTINITYAWRMPRFDRLCLQADGSHVFVPGIAAASGAPMRPATPAGLLSIALVHQTWGTTPPAVIAATTRLVPMNELDTLQDMVDDLYDLAALQRLRLDAAIADPAAKHGVFVDPFNNNTMRDQGLTQTAVAVDGELICGLETISVTNATLAEDDTTLPSSTYTTALEQTLRTGNMKVNPYQAYEPIPAAVTLTPAVDFWTTNTDTYKEAIERQLTTDNASRAGTVITEEELSRVETDAQTLRPIEVQFTIRGFGPGERLKLVFFDGEPVTFST